MCLLTNERYKKYQKGFSFGRLGLPQGWDLRYRGGEGGWGVNFFSSEIQPDLVCELLILHEWHMSQHHFWGPRSPWEGPKGQISFNLNCKVNFKDF